MFKDALYKYSYMYSSEYRDECCIKSSSKSVEEGEFSDLVSKSFPNQRLEYFTFLKYFGFKYRSDQYIFKNKSFDSIIFYKIISIFSSN